VISESEIDQLLLSFCAQRWLKVARIVGKTFTEIEQRGLAIDGTMAQAIDARLEVLVSSGQLEAVGNIKNWRFSEIRLPQV
jgi:hypothetical protein